MDVRAAWILRRCIWQRGGGRWWRLLSTCTVSSVFPATTCVQWDVLGGSSGHWIVRWRALCERRVRGCHRSGHRGYGSRGHGASRCHVHCQGQTQSTAQDIGDIPHGRCTHRAHQKVHAASHYDGRERRNGVRRDLRSGRGEGGQSHRPRNGRKGSNRREDCCRWSRRSRRTLQPDARHGGEACRHLFNCRPSNRATRIHGKHRCPSWVCIWPPWCRRWGHRDALPLFGNCAATSGGAWNRTGGHGATEPGSAGAACAYGQRTLEGCRRACTRNGIGRDCREQVGDAG